MPQSRIRRSRALALSTLLPLFFAFAAPAAAQVVRGVEEPPYPDPYYQWRTDSSSKLLAGKPFAEEVLHRVPGSFHDAPRVPAESLEVEQRGKLLYGPGTPVYVGASICTVAAAGYDARGRMAAITAAHCGSPGTPVASADSPDVGITGTVATTNAELGYALIELGDNAEVTRSYNGVTLAGVGGAGEVGDRVCKQGVASGYTCGEILSVEQRHVVSSVCAMQGDSGAPLLHDGNLIALVNGGVGTAETGIACYSPLQGTFHDATHSIRMDAVLADLGSGFALP